MQNNVIKKSRKPLHTACSLLSLSQALLCLFAGSFEQHLFPRPVSSTLRELYKMTKPKPSLKGPRNYAGVQPLGLYSSVGM